MRLFWPLHPRSQKRLKEFRLWDWVVKHPNLVLIQPIQYHEMLRLNMLARLLLADSGGLQEEYRKALKKKRRPVRPELWDGHSAERCLEAILKASEG